MAKRLSVDEKLSAVRQLRDRPSSPALTSELRSSLGDKSNLIVAAAAAIVSDQNHNDLPPNWRRPSIVALWTLKNDKLCRGKIAVIQALDKLEHERTDIFLRAAKHVQLEPVWGGSEDTGRRYAPPPFWRWLDVIITVCCHCSSIP